MHNEIYYDHTSSPNTQLHRSDLLYCTAQYSAYVRGATARLTGCLVGGHITGWRALVLVVELRVPPQQEVGRLGRGSPAYVMGRGIGRQE